MINIFNSPKRYFDIIRSTQCIPLEKQMRHDGKSMVVVLPTRFCKVGCTHCIFNSRPKFKDSSVSEKDEISWDGCSKTVEFINSANVEYVLIAGGGEPFEKEDVVYHLIEHCQVNRVVIATNGFWGKNYEKAYQIINRLHEMVEQKEHLTLVLRLSLDQWHKDRIGDNIIVHIIQAYDRLSERNEQFILEIHTIENDKSIDELQQNFPNSYRVDGTDQVISDNDKVLKNSKKRGILTLESGLRIPIGYAKLFYPNLLVDLNRSKQELEHIKKPFYDDVNLNQKGNYSVIYNDDGTKGLDYLINFNGNITTWGNYQLENTSNIYIDSYEDIQSNLYNDVISYSFIDKTLNFRENFIRSVNPYAVTRASAINIRDYSGAYLLHEHHTALFYAISIWKHYASEGLVSDSIFNQFPDELSEVIHAEESQVIALYSQSNYSIIQQYMDNTTYTKDDWIDLFKLIQLKHYEVTNEQLKQGLEYFNKQYGTQHLELSEVTKDIHVLSAVARLIERMTFQQSKVEKYHVDKLFV